VGAANLRRKSILSDPRCTTPTVEPDKIHEAFALPKDFLCPPAPVPPPGENIAANDFLNIWTLVARILLTMN